MEISKQEELKIAHDYLKKAEELYYKYRPQLKWVSVKMAMETLGIKSKTTLQKLRDNDEIVYSKHSKTIMYDINSIDDFLERNSNRERTSK
tara:strand:+ start:59524 stop:59796 length:273 start_codon:yes stop_codon:yes gene_type:complete